MTLSTAELNAIREAVDDLFPDTCNILTLTQASDGAGGWSDSWGTTTASAICRLDFPSPGKEAMASASLTPFKRGMVSMPYNTTVTPANRMEINSLTYNIIGVNTNQSWIGVKRIIVEQVP